MGSENTQIANRQGGMTIGEDNDFTMGGLVANKGMAVGSAMQAMAMMMEKKIATARAFPRQVSVFMAEATDLLQMDKQTAEAAEYAKPLGRNRDTGQPEYAYGPSVRLAEIAAMCWGNLEVNVHEPVTTDRTVSVTAIAWDLQRNLSMPGFASAAILYKNGGRYPQHMIEVTATACGSKARRNAILQVIPRAYINQLLEKAAEVSGDKKEPLTIRRKKAVDLFNSQYKVTVDQICKAVGVGGVEDIGEPELKTLRGILASLTEGGKVEEFFETTGESTADRVKRELAEKKAAKSSPASPPAASKPTVTNPMPD